MLKHNIMQKLKIASEKSLLNIGWNFPKGRFLKIIKPAIQFAGFCIRLTDVFRYYMGG